MRQRFTDITSLVPTFPKSFKNMLALAQRLEDWARLWFFE
jgi:hypothetical protein